MSKNKPKPIQGESTIEQISEFAKDTAKQGVKEAFDTLTLISLFGGEAQKERTNGNNDFTDLDVQKLNEAYAKDDQDEIMRLQRLINPDLAEEQDQKKLEMEYHKRIQREEEEYNLRKQQEEEEEKRQEAIIEEQKKQEEEQAQAQPVETPKGKKRRSILGGEKQKATSELPPEFRPDAGKQ